MVLLMPKSIGGKEPEPKIAQIYFYDGIDFDKQIERRNEIMELSLSSDILRELQWDLFYKNPFVQIFVSAKDREIEQNHEILNIVIHNTHGKDMRNYNTPACSEIAALYSINPTPSNRDILIKRNDNRFVRISEMHSAYDPLQYLILFSYGEYGWYKEILRANIKETSIEEIIEAIVEETIEEIIKKTIEDIAEIAIAAKSTDVVDEEQVVEQFDINDNLYKKYINEQLIKYHQENLKQPDITELMFSCPSEWLMRLRFAGLLLIWTASSAFITVTKPSMLPLMLSRIVPLVFTTGQFDLGRRIVTSATARNRGTVTGPVESYKQSSISSGTGERGSESCGFSHRIVKCISETVYINGRQGRVVREAVRDERGGGLRDRRSVGRGRRTDLGWRDACLRSWLASRQGQLG